MLNEKNLTKLLGEQIVEYKTISGWTILRLNNGLAVCLAQVTGLSFGAGTSWAGGYFHACTSGISLPAIFNATPRVFYEKPDAVLSMIVGHQSLSKDTAVPYLFNGAADSLTGLKLDVLAIGTWK